MSLREVSGIACEYAGDADTSARRNGGGSHRPRRERGLAPFGASPRHNLALNSNCTRRGSLYAAV